MHGAAGFLWARGHPRAPAPLHAPRHPLMHAWWHAGKLALPARPVRALPATHTRTHACAPHAMPPPPQGAVSVTFPRTSAGTRMDMAMADFGRAKWGGFLMWVLLGAGAACVREGRPRACTLRSAHGPGGAPLPSSALVCTPQRTQLPRAATARVTGRAHARVHVCSWVVQATALRVRVGCGGPGQRAGPLGVSTLEITLGY